MEKLKEIVGLGAAIASMAFFAGAAVYLNFIKKDNRPDPDQDDEQ